MQKNLLGTEKITPLVLKMAFPIMLSMAVQALYNIADSLFISHYSELAFAGVSLVQPLIQIILALSNGIGAGCGSLLSKCLGAGNEEKCKTCVATALFLSLIIALISTLVSLTIALPFSSSFTDDETAKEAAFTYLITLSPAFIFCFITSIITFILQSHAKAKSAMFVQSSGAVINIVLDPILIFTFKMGVFGAASATAFGYLISFLISIYLYLKLPLTKEKPKFDKECAKSIFDIAIPNMMVQGAGPIVGIVLNRLIVSYSIEAMAVFGMYLKAESFMFLAASGISSALIVIVGYNYGMGDISRVKKSFKISLTISWSIMIIGFILFELFAPHIVSLFTNDDALIQLGTPIFRTLCFCFLLTSPNIIMTGLLQGLGRGKESLIITYSRFFLFLLPIAFLANHFIGLQGICLSFFFADIPTIFLIVAIYKRINKTMLSK